MLVLSRRIDEAIIIAGNIKVRILDVRGNVVSLGLEAPDEVLILREELNERRATDRRGAGRSSTDDSGGRGASNGGIAGGD